MTGFATRYAVTTESGTWGVLMEPNGKILPNQWSHISRHTDAASFLDEWNKTTAKLVQFSKSSPTYKGHTISTEEAALEVAPSSLPFEVWYMLDRYGWMFNDPFASQEPKKQITMPETKPHAE
jgi:hypothetical protein